MRRPQRLLAGTGSRRRPSPVGALNILVALTAPPLGKTA